MIPLQTGSPHPVSHIVFSPDGSSVAVAQPHSGVTILERASGRTLTVCAMPRRASLTGLTFCGDGKYLAAAHAKGLEVFDSTTGKQVAGCHRTPYKSLKLAERDGIAYGLGGDTGGPVWRPDAPNATEYHFDPLSASGQNSRLYPSPDASLAVEVGCGRRLKLHDVANAFYAAEIERPEPVEHPTELVARFCPLGERFALSDGRTLDTYDLRELGDAEEEEEQQGDIPLVQRANGTQTAVAVEVEVAPMPHTLLSSCFSLKPDNPRVTRGWYPPFALLADGRGLLVKRPRNRIQLWDAPTGRLMNEWSWRFEWVTCVAVSTDGCTAVAGGRFGRLLLWDLE